TITVTPTPGGSLSPQLIGFVPGVGNALDVVIGNNLAFLASDTFGLSAVNVSNPSVPVVAGSATTPFYGSNLAVSSSTCTAVSGPCAVVTGQKPLGTAHLWVLDMRVATAPVVLGELPTTVPVGNTSGFKHVALNGSATLAVAALGSAGVWVVDI